MKAPRPQLRLQAASVAAAVLLLTAPLTAGAQGWIEPPVDGRDQVLERLSTDVRVRVVDQVAQVEVTEWFENHSRGVAEGTYLYPLPGEAVFGSFSLWQGDQELRGEVLDAREAREIYEGIVRRRADPALIELAGTGLLRARVFPIEPGQKRKVTLRYTEVLARSGDALHFRYAAGRGGASNVFAVRSESLPGGRPRSAVEDSGRLPEASDLKLELVADEGARFLDPFSPTHELDYQRRDGRLVVRTDGEVRGSLSIFLPLAREGVGLSLATHRAPGEDGYFMLTLSPGSGSDVFEPRDLTVVLDVSGSMSGEKMEQARAAVLQLLGTLSAEDRFRLIAFSNRVQPQSDGWQPATGSALQSARAWVERLRADGGTDISGALDQALGLESPEGRLPLVVFLTDGLPTAGERSAERIAERAEQARGRARVFAFGVGNDVDTSLLDALTAATRGTTTYVEPGENVERALGLLAAKVRHPVLTDLEIAGSPARLSEIYPVTLPDLFAGEALVLFGRYRPTDETGDLRLRGSRGAEALVFAVKARFPASDEGNEYIPRLWASRKIGHLSRQIRLEGPSSAIEEEIRRTALRYGLPSDYTSYLVQEPGLVAGGTPVPPSTPGVSGGRSQLSATGEQAVKAAAGQARMRDVSNAARLDEAVRTMAAPERTQALLRQVNGRLFQQNEGVWTEVARGQPEEAPARTVAIELFSAAYFDVLEALPELAPLVAALDRLEVRGERIALRFVGEGRGTIGSEELLALSREFRGTPAGAPEPEEERR